MAPEQHSDKRVIDYCQWTRGVKEPIRVDSIMGNKPDNLGLENLSNLYFPFTKESKLASISWLASYHVKGSFIKTKSTETHKFESK